MLDAMGIGSKVFDFEDAHLRTGYAFPYMGSFLGCRALELQRLCLCECEVFVQGGHILLASSHCSLIDCRINASSATVQSRRTKTVKLRIVYLQGRKGVLNGFVIFPPTSGRIPRRA